MPQALLDTAEIGVLLDAAREQRFDAGLLRRFDVAWAEDIGLDDYGLWVSVLGMRLRRIPPGRYLRGSPPDEPGRFDWECPQHVVVLSRGFWLAEMPTTQAVWLEVMGGDNPSHFQSPDRPVEQVSWADAQAFCARLGERVAGLRPRLPTEAEWEYACRAGTTGPRWGEDLDAIAWYRGNSDNQTHPVGEKAANPWGLHDMLGNVWEWCVDHSSAGRGPLNGGSELLDPVVNTGPERVYRGGSWYSKARFVRAACRLADRPGFRDDVLGFRLAAGPALSGGAAPSKSPGAGDQPPDGGSDAPESGP